jgi:hypothetical protein
LKVRGVKLRVFEVYERYFKKGGSLGGLSEVSPRNKEGEKA